MEEELVTVVADYILEGDRHRRITALDEEADSYRVRRSTVINAIQQSDGCGCVT